MDRLQDRTRRGERASDQPIAMPAAPRFDRLLSAAIDQDAIDVLFQPQIELASGRVTGVEALARWPGGGVGPEQLFERAASSRLSERLSRLVQRRALRIAGQWTGELAALRVSINLLPTDLERAGFEHWLLGEIALAGLAPERVTVEVTEGGLVIDQPLAAARLGVLRDAGVGIAIDDFGSGYASLAYLINLPIDTLKIDRSLIADIVGGQRDRIVVKALIGLARELGLKIVVEGVENSAQLTLLRGWGCDLYQGFLAAGALDQVELCRFVAAANRAAT